jgi:hypothetical protein
LPTLSNYPAEQNGKKIINPKKEKEKTPQMIDLKEKEKEKEIRLLLKMGVVVEENGKENIAIVISEEARQNAKAVIIILCDIIKALSAHQQKKEKSNIIRPQMFRNFIRGLKH